MFIEGRENVHDEARSMRPSLVIGNLVRKVNERLRDDRRFTISDLSLPCPQISRTLLYDLKDAMHKWLTSQTAAFYEAGIQNLVPRYDKCLNNGGEYVENRFKNVESDNNKILHETLLDFFTAKRFLLSE